MIASLLLAALQAAAPAAPPPALGVLGRQQLPERGCAAFLWTLDPQPRLVAMAGADPARLRLAFDGGPVDLPLVDRAGEGGRGIAATSDYRAGDLAARLTVTVVQRADLADGAAVPQATLSLERAGRDALVVPLAGMIGCRPAPKP